MAECTATECVFVQEYFNDGGRFFTICGTGAALLLDFCYVL